MFEHDEHPILKALLALGGIAAGGYAIYKGAEAIQNQQQNRRRQLELDMICAEERRLLEERRRREAARQQVVQKFDEAVTALLACPAEQQFETITSTVPTLPDENWSLLEETLERKSGQSEAAGVLLALGRLMRHAATRARQLLNHGIEEGSAILRAMLAEPNNIEAQCVVASLRALGTNDVKAAVLFNTGRLALAAAV